MDSSLQGFANKVVFFAAKHLKGGYHTWCRHQQLSLTNACMVQVTNRCPECAKGSIDINTGGDGIWAEQWYAVDCNVGSSSMTYSVTQGSQYYFEMVVSNAR